MRRRGVARRVIEEARHEGRHDVESRATNAAAAGQLYSAERARAVSSIGCAHLAEEGRICEGKMNSAV